VFAAEVLEFIEGHDVAGRNQLPHGSSKRHEAVGSWKLVVCQTERVHRVVRS